MLTPFTARDIAGMLDKIPSRPDYSTWLKVSSAVWSVLPMQEGLNLLNNWSPEEKEGEYATKYKNRLEKVTIGTLVFMAQAGGWKGTGKRPSNAIAPRKQAAIIRPFSAAWLKPYTPPLVRAQRLSIIPPEPVTHCQTCRNRWGRHLLIDYCICTRHVRINSRWAA